MFKKKDVIVTGFALFAMLFGAGNLIFPPKVGLLNGSNWSIAIFAFILTGVGFPLIAIFTSAFAGKDLDSFAIKVSPTFAKVFNILLILSIGPFLALPRTGAVAFEAIFSKDIGNYNTYKIIFILLFFGAALLFSLKPNKVVDRVGAILTPILLIMLFIIIVKGVFISPLGIPAPIDVKTPFKTGFLDGYQTLDALAAIVFSSIILKSIRKDKELTYKQELSFLAQTSIIALGGLALVYAGLGFIGASVSGIYPANIDNVDLFTKTTLGLLGNSGTLILGICVTGACLTTAIGLIATVGNYFSALMKVSYEKLAIITTIVSIIFAMFGVNVIIKISVPILLFLYPIAVALIFLNLLKNKIKNDNVFVGTVIGAGVVSAYEAMQAMGISVESLNSIYNSLPFGDYGFAWLVPAVIGGLIFNFIPKKQK